MEDTKDSRKTEKDLRDGAPDSKLPVAVGGASAAIVPKGLPGTRADDHEEAGEAEPTLRIIPLRNAVLFPHNVLPLTAGKEWSIDAIEHAMKKGKTVGVVTQRNPGDERPDGAGLYDVGTEAKVLKIVRFPDNTYGAILQGIRRFRIVKYVTDSQPRLVAHVHFLADLAPVKELEFAALGRSLKQLVQKAVSLSPNIPGEASLFIENVQDSAYLADLVVPYLSLDANQKQELLEIDDLETRLRRVHYFMTREIEILEMSQKIHSEVKSEVGKQQRKYYVKEQLKLLQKELGDLDGRPSTGNDPQDLRTRIEESGMPQEAKEAALREADRMTMMQPGSPEFMVSHTYVNWLLDVPWAVTTQTDIDLKKARQVLDEDHYGLEKIKKRILEFLAVYSLKKNLKGPILLFVGPPGVGKTSLGKSVARALGRKFVRIALGGVRDEAEIRGHRRTYIGSMPGKIVDALKKAGSMDPVILLDEVDKVAADFRGDPSSALLEVLDSEQNHNFMDHYLNVPVDLSKIIFIATANTLQTIQGPLRDRMEIVELSGYTLDEKTHIAFDHLLPHVVEDHGLKESVDVEIPKSAMQTLIQGYTREAGVRELRRQLSSVARNVATEWVQEKAQSSNAKLKRPSRKRGRKTVDVNTLRKYLGPAPFLETKRPSTLPIGVATGLAYTPVGGDVLYIETAVMDKGTGKLSLTGQLGDVMKESVQTALAYIGAHPQLCQSTAEELRKKDIHVHFPAGAVKKDGPSAGVAVFLGMVSQFSGRPLPSDLAVTGEISLRGDVLPVGGIKEKLLAAHRYGIKEVLIPRENEKDLEDIPRDVLKEMKVRSISTMAEALTIAFKKTPKRNSSKKKR